VVASGVFVATGQNKIIQHFEGGVIREIYVREGDVVEPGQILLDLDDTAARAELQRLFLRRVRLSAIDARLQTEMREEPEIRWPDDVKAALTVLPEANEIIDSQKMAFAARRNNMNSDIKSIDESIKALEERIQGSRIQLDAVKRQIVLLDEEIETKKLLLQTGLVRKPELMVLQRTQANLEGEIGRIMGDIGDAKERIARAVEQINAQSKSRVLSIALASLRVAIALSKSPAAMAALASVILSLSALTVLFSLAAFSRRSCSAFSCSGVLPCAAAVLACSFLRSIS